MFLVIICFLHAFLNSLVEMCFKALTDNRTVVLLVRPVWTSNWYTVSLFLYLWTAGNGDPAGLRGLWKPGKVFLQEGGPGENYEEQVGAGGAPAAWLQQRPQRWETVKNMTNIPQMTSNVMRTCNSCTPSQLPAFTEIRDRLDGLGSVPKRTDPSPGSAASKHFGPTLWECDLSNIQLHIYLFISFLWGEMSWRNLKSNKLFRLSGIFFKKKETKHFGVNDCRFPLIKKRNLHSI